jgi:hypothetical protein
VCVHHVFVCFHSVQMYAIGATLIEVITGQSPFSAIGDLRQVEVLLLKGKISLADTLPTDLGAAWQPLLDEISSYVHHDPTQRPTATQAIARLLAKYPDYAQFVVRPSVALATTTTATTATATTSAAVNNWSEQLDSDSGQTFYYNATTGESVWVRPVDFFQEKMGLQTALRVSDDAAVAKAAAAAAQSETEQLKAEVARLQQEKTAAEETKRQVDADNAAVAAEATRLRAMQEKSEAIRQREVRDQAAPEEKRQQAPDDAVAADEARLQREAKEEAIAGEAAAAAAAAAPATPAVAVSVL